MTSSPYTYVPTAATTLARRLQPVLNAVRAGRGLPPVPLVQVDRVSPGAGDYGTLSASDRERRMAARTLSFRRFQGNQIRDAHLLVIDDVRVTGAHQRSLSRASADATRSSFPGADYIVAVAHAGIAWAKTVAERLDLPLAYVRAEARAAGGPLVECSPGPAARAVIIEDVVASGGSTVQAIAALRAETGMGIAGVQSIANWNFPEMHTRLAGWTVRAVTSYPQVIASARQSGVVSAADARQLLRFYADPRRHRWNLAAGPSPPV
jgi:orotate phosphoribosyltransferase